MKRIAILFLSIFIFTGCTPLSPEISDKDTTLEIDKDIALEKVKIIENSFKILEKHEITSFDTKRYNKLYYKNGRFCKPVRTGRFDDCEAFTKEAEIIFNELSNSLKGSEVTGFYNTSYKDGIIKRGYFQFPSHTFYDVFSYVYEPNNNIKTSTHPYCAGEFWNMPINENWYFECLDWN